MFHSCDYLNDVIFDLNGDHHVGLGWIVFEVDNEDYRKVNGAIVLNNNVFTLKLLRHFNAQQPVRILGYFTDSIDESAEGYVLDDIAPLGTLFGDEIGFILFSAIASIIKDATSSC